MEHEKEIQEIKERLKNVESQLKHKSKFSGFFKIGLIGIIIFVLFLIVVGSYQFISGG
ncbi:hypothetical protein [Paenibacillus gallinarum]|uniref:Uncharacterized protein n=1 Tax=Paenibacillus gallinarum TaxID=2762232 RepID=A0ABR8T0K9_9BACL|nr:hypothetical protein [Paenibacillus gallinarum]MBD7969276.1 hypothetical protein [Paenibacillus gallinarum]